MKKYWIYIKEAFSFIWNVIGLLFIFLFLYFIYKTGCPQNKIIDPEPSNKKIDVSIK